MVNLTVVCVCVCVVAVRTLVDMIADRGEHFDDYYYVGDDEDDGSAAAAAQLAAGALVDGTVKVMQFDAWMAGLKQRVEYEEVVLPFAAVHWKPVAVEGKVHDAELHGAEGAIETPPMRLNLEEISGSWSWMGLPKGSVLALPEGERVVKRRVRPPEAEGCC